MAGSGLVNSLFTQENCVDRVEALGTGIRDVFQVEMHVILFNPFNESFHLLVVKKYLNW